MKSFEPGAVVRPKVGIWIDNREAIIVRLEGEEATVETFESNILPPTKTGGARSKTPYGPQDVASHPTQDRRHAKQLARYYQGVVDRVREAGALLLFGPGTAKQGLLSAFERSPHHTTTATEIATTDKLTQPQIVARVKEHFGIPPARKFEG
jgi:hypothetical protein